MPVEFAPPVQPSGSFNVQPAQYQDPLQTLAEMGQVKQQALQTQQMQMDLQSQQGFMKAYLDANGDPDQAIKLAPSYGVLPKDIFSAQQMMLKMKQDKATLDKTNLESHNLWLDQMRGLYDPLFKETDPNKQATLAASIGQEAVDQGLVTPDKVFRYTDPQSAKLLQAGLTTEKWATSQATQQQAETAAARLTAEKPEIEARTVKTGLENQQTQARLDYINTLMGSPKGLQNLVDSYIDPAKYPDYNKRAVAAATGAAMMKDPKGVDDAIQKYAEIASQQEKTVATETDPRVLQARTQQAVQTEIATSPYKVAQQVASAKALRQGDNPEVAGVAPAAILGVQNQAMKLDEQYVKEKAATESLGKVLDLAQSGNKAAGTNLPLLGVETLNAINGIKRVNSAEIHQYEQTGSLWDNIVGRIGKLTVGKPIPQDVLNDIRTLHQVLGQQSYQNYTDSLNAINARTGATLTPKIAAPNLNRGGTPPVPNTIPAQFRGTAHYSPSQRQFYYSTDGGKSWVPAPLQ